MELNRDRPVPRPLDSDSDRVDHALAALEIRLEQGPLPPDRVRELIEALEGRCWRGSLVPVATPPWIPLSETQYQWVKTLATVAVHAMGGRHPAAGMVWRSDGTRLWVELG